MPSLDSHASLVIRVERVEYRARGLGLDLLLAFIMQMVEINLNKDLISVQGMGLCTKKD